MVRHVYAFLVGIDHYPSPLPSLQGCVNDITAFEQYLHGWIRDNPDYQLQSPHRLVNEQATRQAIIDGFRTYLSQAQASDVALFYYSGHGSQAPSPPEFWRLEPDRFNETLVCWDSRLDGQWDLADKELARLIAEIAQANPHILVILDCCHSGAGTRQALPSGVTRQVPADRRQRPFDSFLQAVDGGPPAAVSRSADVVPIVPRGRHVLLAACRENEEAREVLGDGRHRGAFSYFLLETLKQASGSPTYRDLFRRTQARVRSQVAAQSPQLEAMEPADLDQPFLGGATARTRPYYTVSFKANQDQVSQGWIIDGGAVHGIPTPNHDGCPQVAIFPFEASLDSGPERPAAIAQAEIVTVLPQLSHIRITQGQEHLTDTQAVFKAVLTAVPLPLIQVSLVGDAEGIGLVQQALQTASFNGQASPYVQAATTSAPPPLTLLAENQTYAIAHTADGIPLTAPLLGYRPDQAAKVVQWLEHIARWLSVADLAHPATSQIPAAALHIQIFREEQPDPLTQPQIDLTYAWDVQRQQWQQPTFRIKLINQSDLTLFCALYDLAETFEITSLLEGGTVCLGPREEVWVAQGQPIYGHVPQALWQQGVTEVRDILKAIACTADFDATLLEQPALDHSPTRSPIATPAPGSLNRLMHRVMTRHLTMTPTAEAAYDDWITTQVMFTVIRPQPTIAINPNQAIDLGQGVQLHPHPSFQGTAHLTSTAIASRNLNAPSLPPLLRVDPQITQPLSLSGSRNPASELTVLELEQVTRPDAVTPIQPLTLVVPIALQPYEHVLPIAFDGEFFWPLGRGQTQGTETTIHLERLPPPTAAGKRSLEGSIRIFFQKVVAQKLGLEFPYPLLAAVDRLMEEVPRYESDRSQIAQRVAKAQTILLLIHGLAGDTQTMVQQARQAQVEIGDQPQSLLTLYDLVLTFDYENFNTPIPELAKQLSDRLTSVGLTPDHGKTLHAITHSLGGLVARCWIEQQGGHQVVQHLVLLGTPSAGSPWPTLQDWATAALTIGLNSLSSVALPVKALGSLMAAIELVDVTLDQMKPGSDFLRSLADSADPGIPYTIIAGNAALIPLPDSNQQNRVLQLLGNVCRTALEFPFMSQANDLAATVYSLQALPQPRSPIPQQVEVPCHHLSYLTETAGLQALSQALLTTAQVVIPTAAPTPESPWQMPEPSGENQPQKARQLSSKFWLMGLLLLLIAGAVLGVWQFRRQTKNSHFPPPTFSLPSGIMAKLA